MEELNWYSFKPNEDLNMIKRLRAIKFDPKDRLYDSYLNIPWEQFEMISVLLIEDKIHCFAGIWHRPEYYDISEIRIMNRYWESQELRNITDRASILTTKVQLAVHQLEYCRKNLNYKTVFVTRERGFRIFRSFTELVSNATRTFANLDNKKVPVCNPEAPSCWQYKAIFYLD